MDDSHDAQVKALRELRASMAPDSIDALLKAAEIGADDRLRGVAADQLSMKASQHAAAQWRGAEPEALKRRYVERADRVIALLDDKTPAVRIAMLNVVAKARIKAALNAVNRLAAEDPDFDVRMAAAQALHPLSQP